MRFKRFLNLAISNEILAIKKDVPEPSTTSRLYTSRYTGGTCAQYLYSVALVRTRGLV
jgi:hypothetical protein